MYLPPLVPYSEKCEVVGMVGRSRERADARAEQWGIPNVYDTPEAMIKSGEVDAVVIATANDSHYALSMMAMEAGLHVLCEKPLALTYAEAAEMAQVANASGLTTMTPFTYRFMPTTRYVKQLIDEGFIGTPYHLNFRYYTGFGRHDAYAWRFDQEMAGSGALGDIGSHFLYLADWMFGEVESLCADLYTLRKRPPLRPDGSAYTQADDVATLMLRFKNGAHGVVQATTLAYEDTAFGQVHERDFHGSGGTLREYIDWDDTQRVSGVRDGGGLSVELPVPDAVWGGARRDRVHDTYKDVFRQEGWMVRQWVDGILSGEGCEPDFRAGARIQGLIEAALVSQREGKWVEVDSMVKGKPR